MAIPRHPRDDNTSIKEGAGWRTKALIAVAVALVVAVVVVLHLTGVIGGH
jgi:hypothetical protein